MQLSNIFAILAIAISVNAQAGNTYDSDSLVARSDPRLSPGSSGVVTGGKGPQRGAQRSQRIAQHAASHKACHRRGGRLVARADSDTGSSCVTTVDDDDSSVQGQDIGGGGYDSDGSVNNY
ncbi:uncharacterized protein PgNI_07787 [Pyricularia grisea]|uniref:Uncharacterized protein n=1 Tax=Pyricularia grisea TaxID=148305 RepID=A0A6P8B1X3_PYRGI|nr:uncharacterized protein PgNI_07787 [Pyricularia grisea]TLD08851.1 hypothetical protein PgNI_07787 [Pyricularia grisea]